MGGDPLLRLAEAEPGHFQLESGLHADTWLRLDQLFLRPRALQPYIEALSEKLAPHRVEMVCGPLSGGAFLAELLAERLGVEFSFAGRTMVGGAPSYRIADALRGSVFDKRIALVDDAISAGSAVSGTLADLEGLGGRVVVLGAFILVGERAHQVAAARRLALEWLTETRSPLYEPALCPSCRKGVPLQSLSSVAFY